MDFRSPQIRLAIVAGVLGLWTAAAVARLVDLQLLRYSDFLARAEPQQHRIVEISPKRADNCDRDLNEFAMSTPLGSFFALPAGSRLERRSDHRRKYPIHGRERTHYRNRRDAREDRNGAGRRLLKW